MEKLYCITINWGQEPDTDKIEAALGPLGTWLRFSPNSWLFWSIHNSPAIYSALAPKLTRNDSELIMQIDQSDWYGFGQPWIWKWIETKGKSLT